MSSGERDLPGRQDGLQSRTDRLLGHREAYVPPASSRAFPFMSQLTPYESPAIVLSHDFLPCRDAWHVDLDVVVCESLFVSFICN